MPAASCPLPTMKEKLGGNALVLRFHSVSLNKGRMGNSLGWRWTFVGPQFPNGQSCCSEMKGGCCYLSF